MKNKKKIYFLLGPTCSGKSKIALLLSQKHSFEIISLDSSTIYKGLNIGTDKPNSEILKKHPHHLVNIIEPNESYDVNKFCLETRRLLCEITNRGRTPFLVGGTMMYFDRLLSGINLLPPKSEDERNFIQFLLQSYSLSDIYQTLKIIDIDSFNRISKNDKQRIERALEVYLLTGRSMSSFFGTKLSLFEYFECQIVYLLPKERKYLHRKIEERTFKIFEDGLIDEVSNLRKNFNLDHDSQSMKSIGYRQTLDFLDGHLTRQQLIDECIHATRQLAKRQITWMRRYNPSLIIEIDHKNHREIVEEIETNLHLA